MAIKTGDQKLGLRLREVRRVLLPAHKRRCFVQVPSTLRFIEYGDMLDRWTTEIDQTFIAKVMDILNESSHFASCFTSSEPAAGVPLINDMIPRESFPK